MRKRIERLITIILVALVVFAWGVHADAGNVNLSWDPSTGAGGYNTYASTVSGSYGPTPNTTGPDTTAQITGLADGCVQHYVVVTAFNAAGESAYSSEVPFVPRPLVTSATPADPVPAIITVAGTNFSSFVTVEIDGVPVNPLTAECTELTLPGQSWLTIRLCNGPVCTTHALGVPDVVTGVEVN